MALQAATKTFLLLGRCVPCTQANTAKLKVKRLELDTNVLMVQDIVKGNKVVKIIDASGILGKRKRRIGK